MSWPPEFRPREDGSFDELWAENVDVHFEMMDDGCLWVEIMSRSCSTNEDERHVLWINAGKGRKLVIKSDAANA